jgi:cyclic pyranopterin phosphate synthase
MRQPLAFSARINDAGPPERAFFDRTGRRITYLRLSVTDRCNLHCRYCRPNSSSRSPRTSLLSFEELGRLVQLVAAMGITKIRLTGGEPFLRHDLLRLVAEIRAIHGIDTICLTTNGVNAAPYLDELHAFGLNGLNLSLDTLSPQRFHEITGVDAHGAVMSCLHKALALGLPLKINTVVQDGVNTDELLAIADLARHHPVQIRFIEMMPFSGREFAPPAWRGKRLREHFRRHLPEMTPLVAARATTASIFMVSGFTGTLGFIDGYSRSFCTSCNRIRITPEGILKTCLYDNGALDLRDLLRHGADNETIATRIRQCIWEKPVSGHEAANDSHDDCQTRKSMAAIGG